MKIVNLKWFASRRLIYFDYEKYKYTREAINFKISYNEDIKQVQHSTRSRLPFIIIDHNIRYINYETETHYIKHCFSVIDDNLTKFVVSTNPLVTKNDIFGNIFDQPPITTKYKCYCGNCNKTFHEKLILKYYHPLISTNRDYYDGYEDTTNYICYDCLHILKIAEKNINKKYYKRLMEILKNHDIKNNIDNCLRPTNDTIYEKNIELRKLYKKFSCGENVHEYNIEG